MHISQLVRGLECEIVGEDCKISGLNYDSRKVQPGDVFFAIRGFKTDGHKYVEQAAANGAAAVVVDQFQVLDAQITQIIVPDTRAAMAKMAAAFFQFPSSRLKVIGITGTNGKTTTTYLIKAILEQAGYKVGLIGTIQTLIGSETFPATRTTPESLDLQALLAKMAAEGADYVVMEVSSHALELERTTSLEFDTAVFTNLTQDHLDFHHDFSHYFQAKAKLFANLALNSTKPKKTAVVNFDDPYGLKMAAQSSAPIFSYGIDQNAQIQARDLEIKSSGMKYCLVTPFGTTELDINLTGRFNVYNTMAAAGACLAEGICLNDIKNGLESVQGVPGRFELVDCGQNFAVIVDYAHTPDSLTNVLQTARSFTPNRIIAVFGAGGDRDRAKRPLMGQAAARYSDYVIITSDNPRSEDPRQICSDIEQGILAENKTSPGFGYTIEVSRSKAIEMAIKMAVQGDTIVIAGKGHETYQEFEDYSLEFDDRAEAIRVLKEL